MTLRARITLWHTLTLLLSLAVMAAAFHHELREDRQAIGSGQNPPDSPLEETGEFLLFVGIPIALLLVAGSAWFIRRTLDPVKRLTEAVEGLEMDRLPEPLPPIGTGDELDRLTGAFNASTARLHDSFARVREFTLHASHELKTPLTVMQGELEIALHDEACTGDQRDLLADLLDEVHRLVKIVDGLTLLAKADTGRALLKLESLRFDELVREIFADAQVLARPAGLTVTLASCDAVLVAGDRHRLRQLLLNLTDNAIKFNQPGGRVDLRLTRTGGAAELQVANTGPGVAAEKAGRVFDRFYRGDPAHGSGVEGCGLGLAIAQWITQAHGGEIHFASEPGGLTTVRVRLPAPAPLPTPDPGVGGAGRARLTPRFDGTSSRPPSPPARPA